MGVVDNYTAETGKAGGNGAATPIVKIGAVISNVATSVTKAVSSLINPSQARLQLAGLASGADIAKNTGSPPTAWLNSAGETQSSGVSGDDWRLRLSVAPKSPLLYNINTSQLLHPLRNTDGVIFPITPNLQITHNAKYSSASLTHSNYGMFFYEGSEVSALTIAGEFPVQNIEEGQYLLAAIYFFRAATKMFWGGVGESTGTLGAAGETDIFAGAPPPMLFLNGYGAHYFPNVPCVVTSFMHTMPEGVDYINVPAFGGNGESTRLPTQSTLQVNVQPMMSRVKAATFNLEEFAAGRMITKGFM